MVLPRFHLYRASQARDTHHENYTKRRRLLGPDHPLTIGSLGNYAYALSRSSDATARAAAIPIYRNQVVVGQ